MTSSGHNYIVSGDEDDPTEKAIKNTGCYEKHVQLQECMFDNRDWRICQPQVKLFKECMQEYQSRKKSS